MPTVPGNLVRDAIPADTKAHFAGVPWCAALFENTELVPVRISRGIGSSTSSTSSTRSSPSSNPVAPRPASDAPRTFAAPGAFTTHSQIFYRPALPPPPPSATLPSLTPYEPYRSTALATVGQLHTLFALSYDVGALDAAALEDLAAALLTQQGRALIDSDPDPATAEPRLIELVVKQHRPVRPGAPVLCRAWKARTQGRRYVVGADLVFGPEQKLATAEMVFVGQGVGSML